MATSKEYFEYIKEKLEMIENIRYLPMMGEYLIYFNDIVVGGIYDNRFLMKDLEQVRLFLKDSPLEVPYQKAKKMFLIDNLDCDYLIELFNKLK